MIYILILDWWIGSDRYRDGKFQNYKIVGRLESFKVASPPHNSAGQASPECFRDRGDLMVISNVERNLELKFIYIFHFSISLTIIGTSPPCNSGGQASPDSFGIEVT
ncbi:hypothetical protein [Belliella aquatica]|uniref:hypothetical protein n=1 Tax=Belliella aquatica TaxID=1323734 RepID=UPI001E598B51|nr:hypothetical protein [Belliella aquatica]MCH7405257.1 hypothetical protein [Belliella aquatica]